MGYGFGELLSSLELGPHLKFLAKKLAGGDFEKVEKYSRWERLRMAFEELGPTFIKFGQIMSNRPDMLPPELLAELRKFQDRVPPFPTEEALDIIESELGSPADTLFTDFGDEPVAAASIAQVYRAILESGEEVAVKVRRPGIDKIIHADLEIMRELAELIQDRIGGGIYRPVRIVDEFERNIRSELDMRVEASHMRRFAANFASEDNLIVPEVFGELTGKRILTMEYIDGARAEEVESRPELDGELLASRGTGFILEQIFEHGFFHGDPHPGNIFFLPENKICFLDYGITGRLSSRQREKLGDLLIGIANRDAGKTTDALLEISSHDEVDRAELEGEMEYFFNKYSYLSLDELDFAEYLSDVTRSLVKRKIRPPAEYFMLIKTIITIEGVARQLDPDFNLVESVRPYAEKLISRRYGISGILSRARETVSDLVSTLGSLPSELEDILSKLRKGDIRIGLDHGGLDPLTKKLDQASNRVSFAIVLAALIIGSSLLVLADIPPHLNEIPVIGIVGYIGAAIMAFWLLLSILRHGKM